MTKLSNFYSEVVVDTSMATMLDGNSYRWFDFGDLAAGASKSYVIYIPPAPNELWFYGRAFAGGGSDMSLSIFANPTFSDTGAAMTDRIFNRNGLSSVETTAIIHQNPTILTDGVFVDHDISFGSPGTGNKGSHGFAASQEFPRILVPDSYILSRVTNTGASDSSFSYKLYWSELVGG